MRRGRGGKGPAAGVVARSLRGGGGRDAGSDGEGAGFTGLPVPLVAAIVERLRVARDLAAVACTCTALRAAADGSLGWRDASRGNGAVETDAATWKARYLARLERATGAWLAHLRKLQVVRGVRGQAAAGPGAGRGVEVLPGQLRRFWDALKLDEVVAVSVNGRRVCGVQRAPDKGSDVGRNRATGGAYGVRAHAHGVSVTLPPEALGGLVGAGVDAVTGLGDVGNPFVPRGRWREAPAWGGLRSAGVACYSHALKRMVTLARWTREEVAGRGEWREVGVPDGQPKACPLTFWQLHTPTKAGTLLAGTMGPRGPIAFLAAHISLADVARACLALDGVGPACALTRLASYPVEGRLADDVDPRYGQQGYSAGVSLRSANRMLWTDEFRELSSETRIRAVRASDFDLAELSLNGDVRGESGAEEFTLVGKEGLGGSETVACAEGIPRLAWSSEAFKGTVDGLVIVDAVVWDVNGLILAAFSGVATPQAPPPGKWLSADEAAFGAVASCCDESGLEVVAQGVANVERFTTQLESVGFSLRRDFVRAWHPRGAAP